MPSTTVIFDLDGTLLDTLEDLAHAGNTILERTSHPPHPVALYKQFVGDGLAALIDRILPKEASAATREQCIKLFKEEYSRCWSRKTRPYAGVEKMLRALLEHRLALAVLSNKPHDFTRLCIERFFPTVPFACVFGQRGGYPKKPDPAGALEIAHLLDASPQKCIYVGDTSVDMQTGKRAGMFTIGVLWGFREADELRDNGADLLVATPEELAVAIIGQQRPPEA